MYDVHVRYVSVHVVHVRYDGVHVVHVVHVRYISVHVVMSGIMVCMSISLSDLLIQYFYRHYRSHMYLGETLTACPVFSNSTIIEQPANFLTLHEGYTNSATSFIKQQSGKCHYCLQWMSLYLLSVCVLMYMSCMHVYIY